MGLFDVEGGKNVKLKKSYAVENGKYVKLSKAYVVEGGKYVKVWSDFEPYYISFNRSTTYFYSTDGVEWSSGTLPTSASAESSTFGLGKYFCADTNKNVYYSIDGLTWTLSKTFTFYVKLLRYCSDGYVYAIGGFSAGDNTNWLWRTNDGVNWTNVSVKHTMASAKDTVDFRYGDVNGTKGYYFSMKQNGTNIVSYFTSFTASATSNLYTGSHQVYRAALRMNGGQIQSVLTTNDSNKSVALVYPTLKSSEFSTSSVQHVVSTSSGFVVVLSDKSVYLVNGTTVTKKTALPSMLSSSSFTLFSGAWDGKRIVFAGANPSYKLISLYSDDLGTTWNVITSDERCYENVGLMYGVDGGGYYTN